MKMRMGFVSNSSSSSFVLYGTSMPLSKAVEEIVGVYPEVLIGKELPEGAWQTPDEIFNFLKEKGVYIDHSTSEEGNVRIGLVSDPEYFTIEQLKGGVFKPEEFEKVDEFFKEMGMTPYVDGGEWYS